MPHSLTRTQQSSIPQPFWSSQSACLRRFFLSSLMARLYRELQHSLFGGFLRKGHRVTARLSPTRFAADNITLYQRTHHEATKPIVLAHSASILRSGLVCIDVPHTSAGYEPKAPQQWFLPSGQIQLAGDISRSHVTSQRQTWYLFHTGDQSFLSNGESASSGRSDVSSFTFGAGGHENGLLRVEVNESSRTNH